MKNFWCPSLLSVFVLALGLAFTPAAPAQDYYDGEGLYEQDYDQNQYNQREDNQNGAWYSDDAYDPGWGEPGGLGFGDYEYDDNNAEYTGGNYYTDTNGYEYDPGFGDADDLFGFGNYEVGDSDYGDYYTQDGWWESD